MTTKTSHHLLHSLLTCFIYSGFVGLLLSLSLAAVILSTSALQAAEHDELSLNRINQLSELGSSQLVFRQQDGDYVISLQVATDVDIEVSGLLARVKVSQTFINDSDQWQEGIYVFPLPETAAVDHLAMKIGERFIEGEIQEKKQAQKTYQQAKSSGQRASLLEQQRPNMFTSSVANIAPHDEITIVIEYQQTVQHDNGDFSLRYPMVVAPRYIPGKAIMMDTETVSFSGTGWASNTDQVMDASFITPPVTTQEINPITMTIRLAAGFPLATVNSTYHQVDQQPLSNDVMQISLANPEITNRDFELVWQAQASTSPRAALFKQRFNGDEYALLMLTPPSQQSNDIAARELVFVIDTSGSMDGTSIKQAKQALLYGLQLLRPQDSFNIIRFSHDVEKLFPTAMAASTEQLEIANRFVSSLDADGGTEMLPALTLALKNQQDSSRLRQVVFLTDGSVGNEDALFSEIKQNLGNSRLFTVGIGSAPNSHFMNRAARFGRGTHNYIGDLAEVTDKMQALFNKLSHPVITDIKVETADKEQLEVWPQVIPDLYQDQPLLVVLRASESLAAEITFKGETATEKWQQTVALTSGAASSAVATLWARQKIASLMDDYRTQGRPQQVKQQITELALQHHLVSKFTSLVAVDKTPVRPQQESLQSKAIATNKPAGWAMKTLPQTATPAMMNMLLGLLMLVLGLISRRRVG